jgi:uncharacterized repeat protein (TIGR02543 family)
MQRIAGIVTTVVATIAVGVAPAQATSSGGIALYLSGPLVQGAEIDSVGTLTETFDSLGGSPTTGGIECPTTLAIGSVTTNKTPTTDACQYRAAGLWGGASVTTPAPNFGGEGSNYFGTSQLSDAAITFTFPSGGVKYVGFWWSGGNRGNVVTFYNGATEIASLDTLALETLLGNAPPSSWPSGNGSVTSMGGTAYPKGHYFGNPRGYTSYPPSSQGNAVEGYEDHRGYVFGYLNLFLTGGQTATSVKFSGNGFEFDNLTTSTLEQTPASSLVFVEGLLGKTVQFLPGSNDATGSMVAQASTTAANLSANRYERPGYVFNGWNTAANGTGTAYAAGANFSFATDLTLYAQWQVEPEACTPVTTTFVGGGTADSTAATYGTLGENYTELRFTSLGACDWTVPAGVASIDIALVGGGGGGGSGSRAGGGGAGELAYKTSFAVTPSSSIAVSVGAGGAGGVDPNSEASNGVPTTFGSATALGGGRGAGSAGVTPGAGGSSGGGRGISAASALAATQTTDALSFTRLVNNGGGSDGSSYGAGGGGAGGAAFATATIYVTNPSTQPNGGASFTVFGHELAGGGSGWTGGTYNSVGGGTVGGSNSPTRSPAANTGSGGGAGSTPAGASAGADGVVIVRYLTPSVTQTPTTISTATPNATSAPSASVSAVLASTGSDRTGSTIASSVSALLIILGMATLFTRRHIRVLIRK